MVWGWTSGVLDRSYLNDGARLRSAGRGLPARAFLGQAIPGGVVYTLRRNKRSNPMLCDLLEKGEGGKGRES